MVDQKDIRKRARRPSQRGGNSRGDASNSGRRREGDPPIAVVAAHAGRRVRKPVRGIGPGRLGHRVSGVSDRPPTADATGSTFPQLVGQRCTAVRKRADRE